MALREFRLPDPGEGLTEAEVVTWHVKVGDTVKVNDVVVEIETAKSLVELPVPFAGTVAALLVEEGATVEVGTPIISVDDGLGGAPAPAAPVATPAAASSASATAAPAEEIEEGLIGGTTSTGRTAVLVGYGVKQTEAKRRPRKGAAPAVPESTDRSRQGQPEVTGEPARALAKPPVRKLAKDLGIDLGSVSPSGEGGIVTRADVEAAASGTSDSPDSDVAPAASRWGRPTGGGERRAPGAARETRVPVKGVRKMTAQAMVGSAFTAPHVTEWVTLDVTATMELVERLKQDREFTDVKVTPLLVLAKAMLVALRRNPEVNASWDEAAQEIVHKHYVNLGIAAATPRGLVVPNVKDADTMSMRELAAAIGALTATAREGRTQPAEMSGGTITITNVGVFGVDAGTPILNPGEAAILAFGAVERRPWVVTGADGSESIEPRWVTTLALSFDHRLVDGELGSRYLADVAAILRDPSRGLVWG
ncbi:dihydrolipoamide acetyltransferase family protein [Oryzobacter terrae]|uniref:dihydrolipoamide acetyltransferase family protein n=1 Tax=Oryzobacter terrae TaxID=1620385 RepID=UPI0036718595